jgi:hypothetical protein
VKSFFFCLLGVTIILFVSDLLRLDVVAIFVILALILSGILTPGEALAGFGDPLVVLIGALFVVGDGLFRTGVAYFHRSTPYRFFRHRGIASADHADGRGGRVIRFYEFTVPSRFLYRLRSISPQRPESVLRGL